jgi:hypothetical protein
MPPHSLEKGRCNMTSSQTSNQEVLDLDALAARLAEGASRTTLSQTSSEI